MRKTWRNSPVAPGERNDGDHTHGHPRLRLRRLWHAVDYASAAAGCRDALGERLGPLTALWRDKQLQYTWLRALQARHADSWQVTGDALDFALETLGLDDPPLRARLMDLYLSLDAFPEVPAMLHRLKAAGLKTAILSNGSPQMLDAVVKKAGIGDLPDAVLSVESVGVYKPHPKFISSPPIASRSRPVRSRSSLPMPGTLMPLRPSACASCGATATASGRIACRASRTARSPRSRSCRRRLAHSSDGRGRAREECEPGFLRAINGEE